MIVLVRNLDANAISTGNNHGLPTATSNHKLVSRDIVNWDIRICLSYAQRLLLRHSLGRVYTAKKCVPRIQASDGAWRVHPMNVTVLTLTSARPGGSSASRSVWPPQTPRLSCLELGLGLVGASPFADSVLPQFSFWCVQLVT